MRIQVGNDLNLSTINDAVGDALALRFGCPAGALPVLDGSLSRRGVHNGDGVMLTRKANPRAATFKNLTLCEMVRHHLLALGVDHNAAVSLGHNELASMALSPKAFRDFVFRHGVALSQSTSDFSNLLADSMGKVLRSAYTMAPRTWMKWCGKRTTKDFKTIRSVQLSEAAIPVAMPEGDEYEFGYLSDGAETTALASYGKALKLTRQAVINDDTQGFARNLDAAGRACGRLEETAAYTILTANAALADTVALFATGHNNVTSGALSVESIGTAIATMLAQVPLGGSTGQTVDISAFKLVVPTSKWILGSKLINSPVDPALANETPNPLNVFPIEVVHSPILQANSALIWYLIADPLQGEFVNMWFLEGQEGPRIGEDVEFTTDALMMKYGHDLVAKAVEHRHGVRSTGS